MYIVRRGRSLRVYQNPRRLESQLRQDLRREIRWRERGIITDENSIINAEVIVVPEDASRISVEQFIDAAARGEYP